MEKSNNPVSRLIKAMNASEKRYFKIGSSPKMSLLFDAIDKQKEYDEAVIKKKFNSDKYIGKNLSLAKLNLLNALLKSLREYYSSSRIDFTLANMKADIEILLNKGLPDVSYKVAVRMKALAVKHEQWLWEFEAIHYERNSIDPLGIVEFKRQDLLRFEGEGNISLQKMKNLNEYRSILAQMVQFLSLKGNRTKNMRAMTQLFNRPVLKDEKQALSKMAKIYFHRIKGAYYIDIKPNGELAYEHFKTHLKLRKEIMGETFYDVLLYINALYFYAKGAKVVQKNNEAIPALAEIKKILRESPVSFTPVVSAHTFAMIYEMELEIYNNTGEFEKTTGLVPEIEKGLTEYKKHLTREHIESLYFKVIYSYMGVERYHDALKWLNKSINEKSKDSNEYIQSITRIINLIIHFELGNHELLESLLKSTHHFLSKRKRLYKVEGAILKFIHKQIYLITDKKQLWDAYKEMYIELQGIFKDDFEKKILEYFDFISWVESKIQKRLMAEIVQEKAIQRSEKS